MKTFLLIMGYVFLTCAGICMLHILFEFSFLMLYCWLLNVALGMMIFYHLSVIETPKRTHTIAQPPPAPKAADRFAIMQKAVRDQSIRDAVRRADKKLADSAAYYKEYLKNVEPTDEDDEKIGG